jgi:hypothetical protein
MDEFERYFVSLDKDDKPLAVYRLVSNATLFAEEVWVDGAWKTTDALSEALVDGSSRFEEVPSEQAMEFISANGNSPK